MLQVIIKNDRLYLYMFENKGSLTRQELSDVLMIEMGWERHMASSFVTDFFNEIGSAFELHSEVKITGLGSFCARQKNSRVARNPKTGEDAVVSARRVLTFKISPHLKKRMMNNSDSV